VAASKAPQGLGSRVERHPLGQNQPGSGRSHRTTLLVLADGGLEKVVAFCKAYRANYLTRRSARNRALYHLPGEYQVRTPTDYGAKARSGGMAEGKNWLANHVPDCTRQVARDALPGGRPFLRDGLPDKPVFLIVVRGMDRKVHGRRVKRDPAFYRVTAFQQESQWILLCPLKPC